MNGKERLNESHQKILLGEAPSFALVLLSFFYYCFGLKFHIPLLLFVF